MFLAPLAHQPHPRAQPLLKIVVLPEDSKLLLAMACLQHQAGSVNTALHVNAEGASKILGHEANICIL